MIKQILKNTKLYTLWRKLKAVMHYYKSDAFCFDTNIFPIKHYGKLNKDKVVFVINDANPHSGILSEWFRLITVYNYAVANNFVPVIDLKNYYMPLIGDKESVKQENAWEFYFKQPNDFIFSEVYNSSKVIIAPNIWNKNYNCYENKLADWKTDLSKFPQKELARLKDFYKICPLSSEVIKMAEVYEKQFFPKIPCKILGVSFRREYERNHVYNNPTTPPGTHPVKATMQTIIPEIENAIKKTNCNYFFLSVDDREACEKIKEYFGDKCITTDRKLCHNFENNKPLYLDYLNVLDDKVLIEFNNIKKPVKYRNMSYLAETYLLSKCNSLLSRGGSADLFSMIIKDKPFEFIL